MRCAFGGLLVSAAAALLTGCCWPHRTVHQWHEPREMPPCDCPFACVKLGVLSAGPDGLLHAQVFITERLQWAAHGWQTKEPFEARVVAREANKRRSVSMAVSCSPMPSGWQDPYKHEYGGCVTLSRGNVLVDAKKCGVLFVPPRTMQSIKAHMLT